MSKFKQRLGKMSPQKRLYALETLPGHLTESVQGERLHQLLTDFDFIEAKLEALGVQALIEDYDLARISDVLLSGEQSQTLKLIQGAIRKSAHILEKDKTQLAGHLWGRLLDFEMPQIQGIVEEAKQSRNSPCLWPLKANLERPLEGALRTLTGHSSFVTAVAIARDGKTAISASQDRTLKIWDTETGRELKTLTGHSNLVNAVAIAADGKTAISASHDRTLKIWDTKTGSELKTLTGHSSFVTAVAIARDGKTAISASLDNTLKIWDTETGRELMGLQLNTIPILWLLLRQYNCMAGILFIRKSLKTFIGHSDSVRAVAIAPDGKTAISVSNDNTLKIWDTETGRELKTFIGRRKLKTFTGHSSFVTAVAIAPDGKTAISASRDYTLKIWDTETGRVKTLKNYIFFLVTAMAIAPDGKTAISASDDYTLKIWDTETGRELKTLTDHSDSVTAVAIAPDGKTVIFASGDVSLGHTLKIWDTETGRELKTLTGHTNEINAAAIAPGGKIAISASWGTLKIWDTETGLELKTLTGHSDWVNAVAIAPDGKTAISASSDTTLKIWDLLTGKEVASFSGDGRFNCCAFAPDGVTVVAGDASGRVHFLRLEGMGNLGDV